MLFPPQSPGNPNEHLLTLTTSGGSAAITITPRAQNYNRVHKFSDQQVSQACSGDDRFSRCRVLYIDSDSSQERYIVLAALEDGVGLMALQYDSRELVFRKQNVLSIAETLQIGSISPLDVISFQEQPVVLFLYEQQLRFCFIALNRSDLSQSELRHCARLHTFRNTITYQQVSNFVYYPETEEVLFVLSGIVYGIRFDRRDLRFYVPLGDDTCDHVAYGRDHVLYAYCRSGEVFEFNTDTELLTQHSPDVGVPIPCPLSDVLFTVLQGERSTIVQHNGGVEQAIDGRNFSSAVCSPEDDVLYISDLLEGVTAVNPASMSSQHLNGSVRSKHVEAFEGGYVIIQTSSRSILYDKSHARIAEREGDGKAVGVIWNLTIAETPSTTTPKSDKPPKKSLSSGERVGVGFAIIVALILLLVAAILSVLFVYFRVRK